MAQAAQVAGKPARDVSFTNARRLIWAFAGYQRQSGEQAQSTLAQVLLQSIARCRLPKRPGRVEPRAADPSRWRFCLCRAAWRVSGSGLGALKIVPWESDPNCPS